MHTETVFGALSDPTRRQILSQLIARGECCVCTLYETLNQSQPKISRHLAVLREAGLVQARRDGVWMHYSLHLGLPGWTHAVLSGMAHGEGAAVGETDTACCAAPNKPIIRRRAHV